MGLAVHTDYIFQDVGSVKVLIRFIFEIDEESVCQFLGKSKIVLVRIAA